MILRIGVISIFFASLALNGCRPKMAGGPPPGMAMQVVGVKAGKEDIAEKLSLVGTLVAYEAIEIKSQMSGVVEEIGFEEGQQVEKDQVLFKIDAEKLAASLAESEANLKLAEANYGRVKELQKTRAVAQQEVDESLANLEARRANLELIRQQFEDATIAAPFSGVMGARHVSPGQVIGMDQTLSSLVDLDPLKVELSVPERFISRLKIDQAVEILVAAYPDQIFSGKVYFIAPEIDPLNRTGLVKAEIPNPDHLLKPGMFANLDLIVDVKKGAVVIPEAALILQGDLKNVFVVTAESKAEIRTVQVGIREPGRVEILDGVKEGETVIVEGHQKTPPGAPVTLAPEEKAAPYLKKLKEKPGASNAE